MPQSSFSGRVSPTMNMRSFSLGVFVPPDDAPPPPPTATRPLLSISNPGGMTGYQDTEDNILQRELEGVRLFSSSYTPNPTALLQPYLTLGKVISYSTRPPLSNPGSPASYAGLAETLAGLGGTIFATINHEPENDTPVDQFIANHTAFYEALADVPNVLTGPIYMLGTMTSTGAMAAYRPSIDTMPMDFLGVDGYNPRNARTFSQLFNVWALKARERGVPWIIAEWSTHGTPEQRAAHVRQARTFWENPVNSDLLFVSWFDSNGGPRAGPSGWRIDTALPEGWVFVDNIAQAANPPPETVPDPLTRIELRGAYDSLPPRDGIGPTDPPPPEPEPGQQGALDLGDAAYPIVAGAVYVGPSGSDGAAGGPTTPVRTMATAVSRAGSGGMVVQRAGTYRERLWLNPSVGSLTIQNYPGEEVWWDGADTIPTASWVSDGGDWKHEGWPLFKHDISDADTVDETTAPLAGWPYQMWRNGVPLTHVATRAEVVGASQFYVEEGATTATLWIGSNPAGQLLEASRRQEALISNSNTTVRGVGFRRYAPSNNSSSTPHIGACRSHGDGARWENCHFEENAAAGLHMQEHSSSTVEFCTFTSNGQMGLRGFHARYLNVWSNAFYNNNTKRFATIGAAGGLKIDSDSIVVSVKNNLLSNNYGHGIWLDLYDHYSHVIGNTCIDSVSSAVFWEMSDGCVIAGNIIDGSDNHGILVSEAGSAELWCNTVINCKFPINTQGGGRRAVTGMRARNNVICQDTPPASPIVFRGVDNGSPSDSRSATTMGIDYDHNAVWRRAPTSTNFAQASVGGARVNYANRAAAVASPMNWEANGIASDNTPTNPYIDPVTYVPLAPLLGTGTPLPDSVADLMGLPDDSPRRAAPNIGAIQ